MKRLNGFVLSFVSIFFLIVLSACGGGSSGSGGGGVSFAGTYSGTWNATVTGAGQSQSIGPGTVTIVINSDNTVVIDPASPVPGTGNISGNTVIASWPAAALTPLALPAPER